MLQVFFRLQFAPAPACRYAHCVYQQGTPVNQLLLDFEKHTQLGPTYASELLGLAYSTYAQVRSGARPMQTYTRRHLQVIHMLSRKDLDKLIKEHVRGR
jgi:hypothetical protein